MFLALDASSDELIAIIPAYFDNSEDLVYQFFIYKRIVTTYCRRKYSAVSPAL